MRHLSQRSLRHALVGVEAEPQVRRSGRVHLDVKVALNSFVIQQKGFGSGIRRKPRYIGCRSAEIAVTANRGRVVAYTPAQPIEVTVESSRAETRELKIAIAPEVTAGSGESEAGAKLGELSSGRGTESTSAVGYTRRENVLNPVEQHSMVRWELVEASGRAAVRSFISGTLKLFADCEWAGGSGTGSISVVPLDVDYYNSERQPLGPLSRLVMEYHLWKHGERPVFLDGVQMGFSAETRD